MPELQYCPMFKPGLAFLPSPGLHPAAQAAMAGLNGERQAEAVLQDVLAEHGFWVAAEARYALQVCALWNHLDYAVLSGGAKIARLCPLNGSFQWQRGRTGAGLSRFAYLRRDNGVLVFESPLAGARVELEPGAAASLGALLAGNPEDPVFGLLGEAGFLESEWENRPPAEFWEFHDLLFHGASRRGSGRPVGATWRFQGRLESPPAVKQPLSTHAIPLSKPARLDADPGFQDVLERRRSIREPDSRPIALAQLSEFLYRSVAIRQRFGGGDQELLLRPYPSGGAIHELEFYIAVHRCEGLDAGFYHYHAEEHALYRLPSEESHVSTMIGTALLSWGGKYPTPNLFFTIAARLPRLAWKYQSMAYRITLLNAGTALQTMYLAATAMGLAPCAVGNGDPALFRALTGIDPMEETSVAEFALSSAAAGG
jgi:SagB-type dehydrogenase family enzyme